MLIRSQDKKILCPLNAMCVHPLIRNDKIYGRVIAKYEIHICIGGEYGIIAKYSTEEKAVKVLDMIENFYSNLQYTRFAGSSYEEFLSVIFQMPQDEDVKV